MHPLHARRAFIRNSATALGAAALTSLTASADIPTGKAKSAGAFWFHCVRADTSSMPAAIPGGSA